VSDSHLHALRVSGSHSRQRSASRVPFSPLSFRFAFHRILVSSKANSQSEAIQLAFLTFLPSIFFSGYIFPRETMPTIFYVISYFIPASYYINITRGIILRGAGLSHLWLDGLPSTPWAPFFFSSPPAGSRTKSSWREFSPGYRVCLRWHTRR